MGIALLALSDLLTPLQSLAGRWMAAQRSATRHAPHAPNARRPRSRHASTGRQRALDALAAWRGALARAAAAHWAQAARRRPVPARPAPGAPRPLRVVRVTEAGASPATGRVVLSGRLDDVCAELDRLARLEEARDRQR